VENLPIPLRERADSRSEPGEGLAHAQPSPGSAIPSPTSPASGEVLAPGMLASHYAPHQPVRLNATTATPHEFHIGFGAIPGDASLSPTGDLTQAAARLFDLLHIAEASGRAGIAVAPMPETGLGLAINDRLRRAAAPRD